MLVCIGRPRWWDVKKQYTQKDARELPEGNEGKKDEGASSHDHGMPGKGIHDSGPPGRENIRSRGVKNIASIAVREGETACTGDAARPSEKCTGCMSCVAACALSREGVVSPEFSGIRIYHHTCEWVLRRVDRMYSFSICRQCPAVPPCDEVCPRQAHDRDERTGAVVINQDRCIRCKRCIEACPYDACWYSSQRDKIVKCDLCCGDRQGPHCITVCPSMILKLEQMT